MEGASNANRQPDLNDDERILCSIDGFRARLRMLAMRQPEGFKNWGWVLAAAAGIKEEYDALLQLWPWPTLPYRDDLATAAPSGCPAAITTSPEMDAGAGWREVSRQFAHVLALGENDGSASCSGMVHSVKDCGWAGRLFVAHDHCLLIGGRIDGRQPRESTLVCIARGGHAVPAQTHAVEICLETLAMKLSEVRWRQQGQERCAFVSLSAPKAALCIGAPGFQALVSCSAELSDDPSAVAGRRTSDSVGGRDKTELVLQAMPAGARSLRVRLRALAPWGLPVEMGARAMPGAYGNEPVGDCPVQITVSAGLCVTPHRASLPVTVTVSLTDDFVLPTISHGGGEGSMSIERMILTVAGPGVLTMCREIRVRDGR